MGKNYFFIFLLLLLLSLQGCRDTKDLFSASVMGEIVNPETDYITILKNNTVIDSVPLDGNNQFFYFFDQSKPGFYTFRHYFNSHYESQMFYVEPGDSLQFRLNTRDFDNSLMYSGSGAAKNNFLMDLFNENRDNSRILLQYFLEPRVFVEKTDSINENQRQRLNALYKKDKVSARFDKIAKTLIDFGKYNLHERYRFVLTRFRPQLEQRLPADFLAYRDTVNFNNKTLQTYYTYQYFLDDYLRNSTVDECMKRQLPGNCFDLNSKNNLRRRLKLSDSLFTLESLRSLFLTRYAARLIVRSETADEVEGLVYFLKNKEQYDPDEFHDVKQLAEVQKRQFMGDIGELELAPYRGDNKTIKTIIRRPTVFYYWSSFYEGHQQKQHAQIKELQEAYSQLDFIGINIDNQDIEGWEKALTKYGYDEQKEYQLVCPPELQSYYRNYLNKLVLVSAGGKVVESNLNFTDFDLQKKLAELL